MPVAGVIAAPADHALCVSLRHGFFDQHSRVSSATRHAAATLQPRYNIAPTTLIDVVTHTCMSARSWG